MRNHRCGRRAAQADVAVIAISMRESNLVDRFVQSGSDEVRSDVVQGRALCELEGA